MGADILCFGGRGSVAAFFLCGCWVLLPPPDPDITRGMLASFLVMMALVFLVTVEVLGVYLKWLDLFTRRKGKKARKEFDGFVHEIFSTLGLAVSTIGKLGRVTGGAQGNHRRRSR